MSHVLTLQHVRPTANGFEARLWNFQNDLTIERQWLEDLKTTVLLLTYMIDLGRDRLEMQSQFDRIDELFGSVAATSSSTHSPEGSPS